MCPSVLGIFIFQFFCYDITMKKQAKIKQIKRFRWILWLALAGTIIFLLWQNIVPGGHITYVNNFRTYSDFVGNFSPKERVEQPRQGQQRIMGNPVYFTLRTPRPFNQAKVTITYQNQSDNLPIIETGVLVDKALWRYDLKPLQNSLIDQLTAEGWSSLEQDGTTLWQRNQRYQSLAEFGQSPPPRSQVASYNYRLPGKYYLSDYQAAGQLFGWNYALRGYYQFYVYVDTEELSLNFRLTDLNLQPGDDDVEIVLYNQQDERIGERLVPDSSGLSSRLVSLHRANLPAGVYKVEFKASDDIVTTSLSTTQSKLSFINRLWLAQADQSDIVLYSDSRAISLQTLNPASLQTATVNDQALKLPATYQQFTLVDRQSVKTIALARGDVVISGPGVFSFSPSGLINPGSQTIDNYWQLSDQINYIVANYQSPRQAGSWQTASLEFDLSQADWQDQAYSFILSVPGLKLEDDLADSLIVGEIKIELTGKSLWQKIKELRQQP